MRNPNRNLNRELLDQATMHKARLRGHGKPIYRYEIWAGPRTVRVHVFNHEPIGRAQSAEH